jgi:TonB family protein
VLSIDYLSGPEAMRKDVVLAVSEWHFDRRVGEKPRRITIAFDPVLAERAPADAASPGAPAGDASALAGHPLRSVNLTGMLEIQRDIIAQGLPIKPGVVADQKAIASAVAFVETLRLVALWKLVDGEIQLTVEPPAYRPRAAQSIDVVAKVVPQRIRVPAEAQAAKLISKVEPVYPPLATAARIQGMVHFSAVIGANGGILSAQVLDGSPLLAPSATDAVKQWRYAPTLVNGTPVEIVTEIEVEFLLK